jgi:D-glycero-D-manno-heptose 1,7-bisphosphate phosphatase
MWGIDSNWTLFLDRDGVINHRIWDDYVKKTSEFVLLEGVAESISKFNQLFYKVLVVTNQQGIGKGLMTERNLFEIHSYCSELLKKNNGHIDQYYFAPDLKNAQNNMRKPSSGMALKAKSDFPQIDCSKSILGGDTDSEIEMFHMKAQEMMMQI